MRTQFQRKQQGFSLLVVLILLIVMSILGVAVLRSSAMQERMSANLRDRSLAFQTAEAALRYAQNTVLASVAVQDWSKNFPQAGDACTSAGICPPETAPTDWPDVPAASYDSTRMPAAPEYYIEYVGKGPAQKGACDVLPRRDSDCESPMYRITARSAAPGRATVTLQTMTTSRMPSGS